jgi:hypothetical protein
MIIRGHTFEMSARGGYIYEVFPLGKKTRLTEKHISRGTHGQRRMRSLPVRGEPESMYRICSSWLRTRLQ